MKRLTVTTLLLAFLLIGCGKEDLTPNAQTEKLLRARVWELTETKIDGVISNLYDGLTLTFGSKIYSTTNGGKLWPASGTWDFIGGKGAMIIRNDGLEIEVIKADAANLTISFFWYSTIYEGGRKGSLSGLHVMTFKRKV